MSEAMFYQSIGNSIQANKDKIEKLEKQNARLKKQKKVLQQENKQLKEVIEEVREYIEREDICIDIRDNELNYISTNDLLQILDKPKGEMNNE